MLLASAFTLLFAVLLALVLLINRGKEIVSLSFNQDRIVFEGPYGIALERDAIKTISVVNHLPQIESKRHGFTIKQSFKGIYKTKSGNTVRLLINNNAPPFLKLKLNSGESIYFGPLDSAQQLEFE